MQLLHVEQAAAASLPLPTGLCPLTPSPPPSTGPLAPVGRYFDEAEAAKVYDKVSFMLYGDAAVTNFGLEAAPHNPVAIPPSMIRLKARHTLWKQQQLALMSSGLACDAAAGGGLGPTNPYYSAQAAAAAGLVPPPALMPGGMALAQGPEYSAAAAGAGFAQAACGPHPGMLQPSQVPGSMVHVSVSGNNTAMGPYTTAGSLVVDAPPRELKRSGSNDSANSTWVQAPSLMVVGQQPQQPQQAVYVTGPPGAAMVATMPPSTASGRLYTATLANNLAAGSAPMGGAYWVAAPTTAPAAPGLVPVLSTADVYPVQDTCQTWVSLAPGALPGKPPGGVLPPAVAHPSARALLGEDRPGAAPCAGEDPAAQELELLNQLLASYPLEQAADMYAALMGTSAPLLAVPASGTDVAISSTACSLAASAGLVMGPSQQLQVGTLPAATMALSGDVLATTAPLA